MVPTLTWTFSSISRTSNEVGGDSGHLPNRETIFSADTAARASGTEENAPFKWGRMGFTSLDEKRLGEESNPSPVFQGDGFQDRSARQLPIRAKAASTGLEPATHISGRVVSNHRPHHSDTCRKPIKKPHSPFRRVGLLVCFSVLSARPVPGHPVSDDESKLDELEAKQITG